MAFDLDDWLRDFITLHINAIRPDCKGGFDETQVIEAAVKHLPNENPEEITRCVRIINEHWRKK